MLAGQRVRSSIRRLFFHQGPTHPKRVLSCVAGQSRKIPYYIQERRFFSTSPSVSPVETRSLDGWWKGSTTQLLDREAHPVGSFNNLSWHKAETMILYWAEQTNEHDLNRCFDLLDRLVEEAESQPTANFRLHVYLIHAVLSSWKQLFQKYQTQLLPSQLLEKLEAYLKKVPSLFEPNVATYTIILDGASYCPLPKERIQFSEDLLVRLMIEAETNPAVCPSEVTIGTVLKGLARSNSLPGAEKAEALLRRIKELQTHPGWKDKIQLNTIHYTTVLSAFATAGHPEEAQRILQEMYEESLLQGSDQIRPNIRSFNSVLSAWSHATPGPDVFESAEKIFNKMDELYESGVLKERRDIVSYNSLLSTLLKNHDRVPDAVDKAETLMNDLLERSIIPTAVTFTTLFRILASKQQPETEEKVDSWLQRAQEYGFQDTRFLLDQYKTQLMRSKK